MAFDISTAVEAEGQANAVIPTTKFDISTAEEADVVKPKPSPISEGLRKIFRSSIIEELQTSQYIYESEKNGNLPKPKEGESFTAFIKRSNDFLKKREDDIANEGVLRQIEAPMTLAIGASGMSAPVTTVAMVGGFSIADHFFNARRWIEEKAPNTSPIIKDVVEIADFLAKGALLGGGTLGVKNFIMERMDKLNLPKAVKIPPEQVEAIKRSKTITEPLGLTKDQMDASVNSGTPIQVPIDKVLDLAGSKNWDMAKEKLSLSETPPKVEAKAPEIKVPTPEEMLADKKTPLTKQAINFAETNRANKEDALKALEVEEGKITERIEKINKTPAEERTDAQDAEGFQLGQIKQFYREAREALEGKISNKRMEDISAKLSISSVEKTGIENAPKAKETAQPAKPELQKEDIVLDFPSQQNITDTLGSVKGKIPESKERGFVTSVRESEQIGKEVKDLVAEKTSTYEVYTDKVAIDKAQERVSKNPEEALSYVLSKDSLDKDVTTTGLELMRRYREQGNVEQEVAVASALAEKGTQAGQFIQAYSILDKLSPEGVLVFAQREINKGIDNTAKRKMIDKDLADQLKVQAQVIQDTPYGYQKVKEINKLMEMIANKRGKKVQDWLIELANVPRTMMSSMLDFSFGFRQGLFMLPSFPKEWGGAFMKQFGAFAKEKNYDALMDSIMKHPDYILAENSGVSFTDIRTNIGRMEEAYMGATLTDKVPLVGGAVRATNRAYTGMANKMRMDIFSRMVKDMENVGLEPRSNKKLLQEVATFVNAGTGRGPLGGAFAQSGPLLNSIFFSPRLMSSRLTLLNPAYYITRSPGLRKQALKSLFSFMGLWGTILTIAKLSGGEVGTDPRSSDFGKIKINNTRIDVGGGFAQWMRMMGQQVTGEYVSSTTSRKLTLGEGYKPLTRYDILLRQLESKESPVVSLITNILRQQDYAGNPISVPKEVAERFIPMIAQDINDLIQEDPDLLPLALLPIFGVGVQTYEQKKSKKF